MAKHSKKGGHEHDMTTRLVLFALIVFMVTVGLVFAVSRISPENRGVKTNEQAEQTEPKPSSTIVGEGGISKVACDAAGGYWIECGSPCHGQDQEFCIQACEPQCLCGGSNEWQCPVNFHCTDFEKLASDEREIGVCRVGEANEEGEDVGEEVTEPIREAPDGMLCDDLNFICIDEEIEGALLESPFEVSGSGIAFENTISWELLDEDGQVIVSGFETADAPDIGQPGDFTIRAFLLRAPGSDNGTLRVFEHSAKDGEPIHVVEVPVQLPDSTMEIIFFSGPLIEEDDAPCTEVYEQTGYVARSILPIESTLRYLLASHLWEDRSGRGASTNIPKGTELESISVSGGVARVTFSPELENYGGGSCNVQAIRAQIEETLLQFSSVNSIEISVTGKSPDETLQP